MQQKSVGGSSWLLQLMIQQLSREDIEKSGLYPDRMRNLAPNKKPTRNSFQSPAVPCLQNAECQCEGPTRLLPQWKRSPLHGRIVDVQRTEMAALSNGKFAHK